MAHVAKPKILLLSLSELDEVFSSVHSDLLRDFQAKANVSKATTARAALEELSSSKPAAVFVTDAAISERQYRNVCSRLVEYARGGGIVVIGGIFSSFVKLQDLDDFFQDVWGLPWKKHNYQRLIYALNPTAHPGFRSNGKLPTSYSMKAVSLMNVVSSDIVYKPTNTDEAPVAYARIGDGYFGYIGDVNGEEESTRVVLAMCGLPL